MEATLRYPGKKPDYTPVAALTGGQVIQLADGRASVSACDVAAGVQNAVEVEGAYLIEKVTAQVWIDGAPLWWDHSLNLATCVPQYSDRDFYLGTAVGDVATAVTSGLVNLNGKPQYIVDVRGVEGGGGGDTAVVLTAGAPYVINRGGMLEAAFSATGEAQKLDWLSRRSFPKGSNWVLEACVEVSTAPDAAAVDVNIGVASATHATDFESVAEFAAFHLDGDDLNIDVHSDDGTTDVAPVDSTLDWVAGTPVYLVLDGRDETDIKAYVNGVRVLDGTTGADTTLALTAGSAALKAIFHAEKTSDDSPGVFQLDALRVRIAEQ